MARVCSNCGQRVKDTARFCKFCGYRLVSSAPDRAPAVRPRPPATVQPQPQTVTEVPTKVLAQLEARAELMELEQEEQEAKREIEQLEAELERGDRSIAQIEKQMKPLQKRIKELKSREKKLKAKVKGFPFEKAIKERARWTDRLEKLEELRESGKVRESVYKRLKEEYETSRSKADTEYQEQVGEAREWLALLKAQYKAARDELAMLETRHAVGEVKDTDYKEHKAKLEKRTQRLGNQVEILEGILRDF